MSYEKDDGLIYAKEAEKEEVKPKEMSRYTIRTMNYVLHESAKKYPQLRFFGDDKYVWAEVSEPKNKEKKDAGTKKRSA